MKPRDPKTPKFNTVLVEEAFRLMFETLWLPPYDRRRQHPAFVEYEVCIRHAVRLLSATDPAQTGTVARQRVSHAVQALVHAVGRVAATGIFHQNVCEEARRIVHRIEQRLEEKAEETPSV